LLKKPLVFYLTMALNFIIVERINQDKIGSC
jgi:hypothetical protein